MNTDPAISGDAPDDAADLEHTLRECSAILAMPDASAEQRAGVEDLLAKLRDLRFEISNLKSQISNLKFHIGARSFSMAECSRACGTAGHLRILQGNLSP